MEQMTENWNNLILSCRELIFKKYLEAEWKHERKSISCFELSFSAGRLFVLGENGREETLEWLKIYKLLSLSP